MTADVAAAADNANDALAGKQIETSEPIMPPPPLSAKGKRLFVACRDHARVHDPHLRHYRENRGELYLRGFKGGDDLLRHLLFLISF